MKLIVDFIEKYGGDALYHFGFGALLTALGLPFGFFGVIIAFIIMFVLSVVKEQYFDVDFDWVDIKLACLGGICILIYQLFLMLIL